VKIGDAIDYDPGSGGVSLLALVTKVHDAHTVDLLWCDADTGGWHAADGVPERAEGGGVTWRPLP
jgi:hypothetical protein